MSYTYGYINRKKETMEIEISDEQQNIRLQADQDFETSFAYVRSTEYRIWRAALKSYHLSTHDRKAALWNQTWKQNITIWLVRSFTDVMVSAVNEKPLVFSGKGVNKLWIKNKLNILKTLNYISDVSGFHTQLKKTMKNGLIVWEIAMRIWYLKTKKKEKTTAIINNSYVEETIEIEKKNYPYATNVNIFNIFPDPYNGLLRYVTERWVVSYNNFIQTFWQMIRWPLNKSPLWTNEFLELLPINSNSADYDDYGNIENQIHQKYNEEQQRLDSFIENKRNQWTKRSDAADQDTNVTEGLIEFKITWYKTRVVLLANWYPVYIWKNPYGFIPYVVKAATETDMRFWEGIPYMIKPLEDVWNSFINNYFDSARSIANPTIVVNKNLMINDDELENWTPGWVLYAEWTEGWKVAYRLDKWGLQDFNIMELINQIAQQITWISEYNLWISAKERTASWALSVTQSSQRRLSPYISTFLDAISIVAKMWLELVKKYWTEEQFIYVLDEDWEQVAKTMKAKHLMWWINISLNAEGMFWAFEELELQKLVTMYQTLAPSWFVTSPEIAKEIIRKSWFEPSRFITDPGEGVIPEWMNQNQEKWTMWDADATIWDILKKSSSPQINKWNWWRGNQNT